MTVEEAGEEILMGHPYVTCALCKGEGVRRVGIPGKEQRRVDCRTCFGKGSVPRVAYHEAARQLGLAIPPLVKKNAFNRRRR